MNSLMFSIRCCHWWAAAIAVVGVWNALNGLWWLAATEALIAALWLQLAARTKGVLNARHPHPECESVTRTWRHGVITEECRVEYIGDGQRHHVHTRFVPENGGDQ